jgi:hypothetical protein
VRVLRSLAAVIAGCALVFGILRGLAPNPGFVLGVIVTIAGAMAGGFLTAWIAGSHEIPHAAGVGLALIVMSVLSMREQGAVRPGWYETAIAGCGPIAAMVGAAVRMLAKKR